MNEKKRIIAKHFNATASAEENNVSAKFGSNHEDYLLSHPYKFIEEIISEHNNKKLKILDYCCGTGIFSIFPALQGHEVYGTDISERSVEIAKKKSLQFNLENRCFFYCADSEKLDFNNSYFDIVLCYNSLSYLDLSVVFEELKRVIKPDGQLIIMDSLGHNIFYNLNRKANIARWGKNAQKELQLLKMKDISLCEKYFLKSRIRYFGFIMSILYFISKRFKLEINRPISEICSKLDDLLFKLPFSYFLAFKFVAVFHSLKEKNEERN